MEAGGAGVSATKPEILLLSGGPDAEREVSLTGARAVESALRDDGWTVHHHAIDTPALAEIRALPGEVVFPLLHGRWGEGGPLQDLLERDGRPFVGCAPRAARLAMDKVASKCEALAIGLPVTATCIFDPRDEACPLDLPVVVKPVHEGSTVGLWVCTTPAQWRRAQQATAAAARPAMVEPFIPGRELTVGVVDGRALPIIEIVPKYGLYDYDAKYTRDDTRYLLEPDLPGALARDLGAWSLALARRIGAIDIARIDWRLDERECPWLLEINTMPGFTSHSLVPMAAAHPGGGSMSLAQLGATLIRCAQRRAAGAAIQETLA